MNCSKHPEREAAGICVRCGKLFCAECLVEIDGKMTCRSCVNEIFTKRREQPRQFTPLPKSKSSALLLCIFLGGLGAHRFYLGYVRSGLLLLSSFLISFSCIVVTSRCSFLIFINGVVVLADFVTILQNKFCDAWERPLV